MASAKDIYEAHIYRANIYAAGVWRGVGQTVEVISLTLASQDVFLAGAVQQDARQSGGVVQDAN